MVITTRQSPVEVNAVAFIQKPQEAAGVSMREVRKFFVERPKPSGKITGQIQHHDAILVGPVPVEPMKIGSFQGVDRHRLLGDHTRGTRDTFDQTHFPEKIPSPELGEHYRLGRAVAFHDGNRPAGKKKHPVTRLALANNFFTRTVMLLPRQRVEELQSFRVEPGHYRDVLQKFIGHCIHGLRLRLDHGHDHQGNRDQTSLTVTSPFFDTGNELEKENLLLFGRQGPHDILKSAPVLLGCCHERFVGRQYQIRAGRGGDVHVYRQRGINHR